MKIFYAVQATGNGHISRAMEILPHLQQYGTVDLFLSGSNSNLAIDANVQYRSKGLSFVL
jgi:spore coat polysaccharide biosynthesis predicted glycosyltransferase SpsG